MRALALALLLLLAPAAHAKKPAPPPPAAWAASADQADALRAAADALLMKKLDEAAAGYRAVLAAEPECGLALWGLGRTLLAQGKPADAVDPLTRATALFGDKYDPWVHLSQAQLGAGNAQGALDAANRALALKPLMLPGHEAAQKALIQLKDYAQAHAMIQKARDQSWMVQWDCLDGFLYVEEGKADEARAALEKCRGVPDAALLESLEARVNALAPAPTAATP